MGKKEQKPAKHVPQRTCIACREILPKRTMTRIVRTETGIQLDRNGKLSGRGTYLHDRKECWEKAILRGLVAKNLRVTLTDEDQLHLKEWMNALPDET